MRFTVVALTVILLGVGTATAGPKVALTAMEGDDSGSVREAVAEALDGKELSILGAKETGRQVGKLKIELPDMSEKQAKKLQTELEADAVVMGAVSKEDGTKILRFKLFVNGKKVKGFSIQFSNPKAKKFKDALKSKMVEKLEVAGASDEDKKPKDADKKVAKKDADKKVAKKDPDAEADDPPKKKDTKKKKVAEADEGDDPPKKKDTKKKKGKKDKPEPKADGEPDEGDPEPVKKKKVATKTDEGEEGDEIAVKVRAPKSSRAANTNAARVDIGGSMSSRSLTFTFTPELAADGNEPKPFKPGPVPGARVEGEIYPLAFSNPKSFGAGLGIAFEFDQVLSSKVQTEAEPGSIGKVKQQHFMVGARYRLALGKSETSPTLTAGVGYAQRAFVVKAGGFMDRSALDLPDTNYKYIAPLLGFRLPFTRNIAMLVQGDAMLVSDAGPISKGTSYGKAKVFGIDAKAGLDVVLGSRFALRFMFEYSQIGFTFTGGGDLANSRDGDATTPDIGGALDRTLGGAATFAVLY